jgi:hypothetical protein
VLVHVVILTLWRLRQEDLEFKASLCCIARPDLRETETETQRKRKKRKERG